MINRNKQKLLELIKNHVEAQLDLSWSGGKEPEDREMYKLEAEYHEKKLKEFIKNV